MSSTPPSPLALDLFRRACGQFPTGVVIATVSDEKANPHGLTINSFTSVSLEPPLVLFCIDYRAAVLEHFLRARHYGLSFLEERQTDVSNRFAWRAEDRFEGVHWTRGVSGVPLLEGSLATMECIARQVYDGGDHSIFVVEVTHVMVHGGQPLVYYNSAYRKLTE